MIPVFYLTGGTCLHRFYLQKRYSDDLDFFCNDNDLFRDYVREVNISLQKNFTEINIILDSRDFVRVLVNQKMKIDFVNDRVYYYDRKQISKEGFKIDNILANKITAVIGRDEPKDIVDIFSIFKFINIDWETILEIAQKKCYFEKDYFLYRLQSFPL